MTTLVDVVYEGGVLRPLQTLDWQEGERHSVAVQDTSLPASAPPAAAPYDPERAKEIMAEIAALSVETGEIETASTDHDKILYGGPNGAW